MFFDLILLRGQNQGCFQQAWIAATRGVNHLSKETIIKVDICHITDEIMKYITSQSNLPKHRFSLRMSSILLNGVVRIQNKKATFLLNAVVGVFTKVTTPFILRDLQDLESPSQVIIKKAKKGDKKDLPKNKPPADTPESVLETFANKENSAMQKIAKDQVSFDIPAARTDDISIREVQPIQFISKEDELGTLGDMILTEDEFNNLMMFPQTELKTAKPSTEKSFRKPLSSSSSSSSIPPRKEISKKIVVEAQVLQSAGFEFPEITPPVMVDRDKNIIIQEPHVIEAPINQPAEFEEIVSQAPTVRENLMIQKPQEDQVELPKENQDVVIKEKRKEKAEKTKPRKTKKKFEDENDKTRAILQPVKNVRIGRFDNLNEVELIDINECPRLEFQLRDPQLKHLLDKLLGSSYDSLARASESHSLRISTSLIVPPKQQVTPPLSSELQLKKKSDFQSNVGEQVMLATTDLENEFLTSTPLTKKLPRRSQRHGLESISELGEHAPLVTVEIDTIDPALLHVPLIDSEITVNVPQDDVQIFLYSEKQRHQDIIEKLMKSKNGKITLEDAAEKPLKKITVSRAFMDVLVLAKSGYVTLTSEENSLQLMFIEKGPKCNQS